MPTKTPGLTNEMQRMKTYFAIRDAALAILESRGVKGISMQSVAAEACLDRATPYRYHRTLQHLLDELAHEVVVDFLAKLKTGDGQPETAWWVWWKLAQASPERVQLIFASPPALKMLTENLGSKSAEVTA